MSNRRAPSASPSTSAMIVGVIILGILVAYFSMADALNISTDDNNFINTAFPYFLFLGLASLGGGIGIKAYHWKRH